MEKVIDMMEETFQICEKAHRSMRGASHRRTFKFGLRSASNVHTRQAASSIQIQSGRQEPSGDLKVEPRTRRDPLDVPCIYHKGARHTLRGCRCGRRSIRSATSRALLKLPRLWTTESFRRPGSTSPPTTRDLLGDASWWSQRKTHHGSARRIPRRRVGSKPTRTAPRGGRRSSARRYPRVPATCASSSKRRGSRRSTTLGPTWVRH
jgi:hypothetical protein